MISQKPSLVLMCVRVIGVTMLVTLLGFCISLFFSIVGIVLVNAITHRGINLAFAYRRIAVPIAIAIFIMAFFAVLTVEFRHYRRARYEAEGE